MLMHIREQVLKLKSERQLNTIVNMDYKSENVIYSAIHSACENNYIGKINKLYARLRFLFFILRLLVPSCFVNYRIILLFLIFNSVIILVNSLQLQKMCYLYVI